MRVEVSHLFGRLRPHPLLGQSSRTRWSASPTTPRTSSSAPAARKASTSSHFLGAAYGMERIMGRADTPVRRVLVRGHRGLRRPADRLRAHGDAEPWRRRQAGTRGLFVGDGLDSFTRAAALSLEVNFQMLDQPLRKVVVYLDPAEFKSTWLGNKSIYRTRMAMADGGELIVLAPGPEGVRRGSRDRPARPPIRLPRHARDLGGGQGPAELPHNLSAAAHLIHGRGGPVPHHLLPGPHMSQGRFGRSVSRRRPRRHARAYNPETAQRRSQPPA